MAGKSIPYIYVCQEEIAKDKKCNLHQSSGKALPATVKELEKKRFCPNCRKHTLQNAKPVKKGGTKMHANK